ncbi:MAG: hypothetical protein ACE5R6_14915 [Candidatus Heimdallarchaeota archaeon]
MEKGAVAIYGVYSLVMLVNNFGVKPIVILGRVVKSINQFYNKEQARLQQIYDHQEIKTGMKLKELTVKQNHKLRDYFHKVS